MAVCQPGDPHRFCCPARMVWSVFVYTRARDRKKTPSQSLIVLQPNPFLAIATKQAPQLDKKDKKPQVKIRNETECNRLEAAKPNGNLCKPSRFKRSLWSTHPCSSTQSTKRPSPADPIWCYTLIQIHQSIIQIKSIHQPINQSINEDAAIGQTHQRKVEFLVFCNNQLSVEH